MYMLCVQQHITVNKKTAPFAARPRTSRHRRRTRQSVKSWLPFFVRNQSYPSIEPDWRCTYTYQVDCTIARDDRLCLCVPFGSWPRHQDPVRPSKLYSASPGRTRPAKQPSASTKKRHEIAYIPYARARVTPHCHTAGCSSLPVSKACVRQCVGRDFLREKELRARKNKCVTCS